MEMNRRSALFGIAAAPMLGALLPDSTVTVFQARQIVTMERSMPSARFVAVANGEILGIADSLEALSPWTAGRKTTVDVRFADHVLFPGLIDPHIHPMQSAVMLNLPFLAPDDWSLPSGEWPGVTNQADYRRRLKQIVDADTSDPIIVWGHHELFHGPLHRSDLDAISPNRALIVWQRSFHEIIVNSAALAMMGLADAKSFGDALTAGGADLAHSSFEKGIVSETGLVIAIGKLRPILLSPQKLASGFAGLREMMVSRGVTTTSDMATGIFAGFDIEAKLIAANFGAAGSAARVMLMPIAKELDRQADLAGWLNNAHEKYVGANVRLDRRVKLFADGAFFAQNMRMASPGYSDGHEGKWLTEPDLLNKELDRFWSAGFSLHIHVNGDEGAEVLLDGIAKLPPKTGQDITLEHLGYVTEAQAVRIAEMGLMVSAQPNYIRVLGEAYSKSGLGADRAALMNRLGSLERKDVPLGLHSDFNMAPIDPFYLAWIASTREGIDGKVRGPDERLSRDKALRSITIEAARVIGMDGMVGSIAAGKRADFVALRDNPFDVETAALKNMPIDAVVFEGRVVRES